MSESGPARFPKTKAVLHESIPQKSPPGFGDERERKLTRTAAGQNPSLSIVNSSSKGGGRRIQSLTHSA